MQRKQYRLKHIDTQRAGSCAVSYLWTKNHHLDGFRGTEVCIPNACIYTSMHTYSYAYRDTRITLGPFSAKGQSPNRGTRRQSPNRDTPRQSPNRDTPRQSPNRDTPTLRQLLRWHTGVEEGKRGRREEGPALSALWVSVDYAGLGSLRPPV